MTQRTPVIASSQVINFSWVFLKTLKLMRARKNFHQADRQVYDPKRETCVSRIGFTCSHDTTSPFSLLCVDNAVCDMPIIDGIMIHSCICEPGYRMTKQRLCTKIPAWPPIRP